MTNPLEQNKKNVKDFYDKMFNQCKPVVTGQGNVVHAVTSLLAQRRVIAEELRIEQNSLEDAYLALTGRQSGETDTGTEEH